MNFEAMFKKMKDSEPEIVIPETLSERVYKKGKFNDLLETIGFSLICIVLVCMIAIIVIPDSGLFSFNISSLQPEFDNQSSLYSHNDISIDLLKVPLILSFRVSIIALLITLPFVYLKERK